MGSGSRVPKGMIDPSTPGFGSGASAGFNNAFSSYEPTPKPTWMEGGNLSARDAIGLALMSLADTANGGSTVSSLMQGRASSLAKYKQQGQILSDLMAQGYAPAEARLMMLNPEAIGTNMAGHAAAYSLGKGDVRFNNNRAVAERPDMFTTEAGDHIATNAAGQTQEVYHNTAPKIVTTQNSVYAIDPHTGGQANSGAAPSGPPPQAIADLQHNPALKAQFDQAYGLGAADHYLGGAATPAQRPFPAPFPTR